MNSPAVQKLLEQLAATIRAEVQQDVLSVFGQEVGNGRRASGRAKAAAPRATTKARAKGAKRSPEELNKLVMNVERYIRKYPGKRAEEIATALGIATKDLVLPIAKLGKAVRTKGQKRGTTYFAR